MLMSLARREPGAAAAIAARGPNIVRRAAGRTSAALHVQRGGR
jgi:hypothetical protein